jgi:uncharacterized cofD-like protein
VSEPGGPSVVAIGGGHGLSVSLRAATAYAGQVTGVVSVADDGGSSGLLRAVNPGLVALGDLRRCLSSLAPPGTAMARALEYRFGPDLHGHAAGNLLLAALVAELDGDLTAALDALGAALGSAGRVLPATTEVVDLCGTARGDPLRGQMEVQNAEGIDRVWLEPASPEAHPGALAAVAAADQIIIGPGSLYTSVLAALAVPALGEAVAEAKAGKVYVANLAPQIHETVGYDLADHLRALDVHGVRPDVVIYQPDALGPSWDVPDGIVGTLGVEIVERHIARPNGHVHDPDLLAGVLRQLVRL